MKLRFPSKRDWWLGLIIWLAALVPLGVTVTELEHSGPVPFVIALASAGLLLSIWFRSYAAISGTTLTLRTSFLTWSLDVMQIRSIALNVHRLNSNTGYNGGLSLDRIAIRYNTYDEVFYSPKDKQAFADALRAINPQIQIE